MEKYSKNYVKYHITSIQRESFNEIIKITSFSFDQIMNLLISFIKYFLKLTIHDA